jgi:LPS export ABC transporter protein LptC
MKKKIVIFFFVVFFSIFFYSKIYKKDKIIDVKRDISEEIQEKSNIMKDVNYLSTDAKGNQYIINATEGEIDYSNSNIIYLKDVKAIIHLNNSNNIEITSDYGKYNTNNYETIFSKNVIINYLDNKITSEYLDFSIKRNSMIISKNVIYTNLENMLEADVVEIDITTKDTKIYMYDNKEKVIIKSKN